jgi:hypothetical protein
VPIYRAKQVKAALRRLGTKLWLLETVLIVTGKPFMLRGENDFEMIFIQSLNDKSMGSDSA